MCFSLPRLCSPLDALHSLLLLFMGENTMDILINTSNECKTLSDKLTWERERNKNMPFGTKLPSIVLSIVRALYSIDKWPDTVLSVLMSS